MFLLNAESYYYMVWGDTKSENELEREIKEIAAKNIKIITDGLKIKVDKQFGKI